VTGSTWVNAGFGAMGSMLGWCAGLSTTTVMGTSPLFGGNPSMMDTSRPFGGNSSVVIGGLCIPSVGIVPSGGILRRCVVLLSVGAGISPVCFVSCSFGTSPVCDMSLMWLITSPPLSRRSPVVDGVNSGWSHFGLACCFPVVSLRQ